MASHCHSHPSLFPLLPLSCIIILLISLNMTPYVKSLDYFSSCSKPFSCGNVRNVGFPFWGGGRADGCGYPGLQLNCTGNSAYISINNITYLVKEVDPESSTLKIVRVEFMKGPCPDGFRNSGINILDHNLFDYIPGYQNLTLLYGCNVGAASNLLRRLDCPLYVYLFVGFMDPIPEYCKYSVVVPVHSMVDLANSQEIGEALKDGFEVKWIVGIEECDRCQQSGGVCGYDSKLNQPTCYCKGSVSGSRNLSRIIPDAVSDDKGPQGPEKSHSCRDDFWDNLCPNAIENSTFDTSIFKYTDDIKNMTLFYQCNVDILPQLSELPKEQCTDGATQVYATLDPPDFSAFGLCDHVIFIPILGSQVGAVKNNNIKSAIHNGFELEWVLDNDKCYTCTDSGGECGNDSEEFACFCKDGLHRTSCSDGRVPMSLCSSNEQYLNCSSSFDCANLHNLSYPFWGSQRPEYCGHPAFKLECSDEVAEITIRSEKYRVLKVSDTSHSLNLVSTEFWNNTCPTYLGSNAIDCSLFDFGSDSKNLTLYYDCPSPPFSLQGGYPTQFNCSINNTEMVNYFMLESIPENAETSFSASEFMGACKSEVLVPILESQAKVLGTNSTVENLKAALSSGFELEWNANNSLCHDCQNSGGHCGYSPSSGEFTCHCRVGSFHSKCQSGKYPVS
ncbi:hypothetical protein L6164_007771 [Bauhinia variegata]|uniref:Uncharacterized protein n=1 Tax=Bauhinia variegata TaxID=167791 RepID=A0ACB9PEL9_BAUVA|nr:hypothetical protein L6164_007771 [Bauhinia variegata]